MNDLRENVKNVITRMFNSWDSSEVITGMVDNITEDVVEDMIETSDILNSGHYNDSDIEMAIKRVILRLIQLGK